MIGALWTLAVLAATPALPCDDLEGRATALRALAASDTARFEAELANLGPVASLAIEADQAAAARAQLAVRRLTDACALAARATPPGAGVQTDRARLAAILDRPEFSNARHRNSNLLERWFARFRAWLLSLLETSEAQSFSEASRLVILATALAVIVGGAARLLTARRRRARVASPEEPRAGRLELQDPAVHLAAANAALGASPREAIRQGLLCLLSALERSRLARPDRVKTNRELAAELPERGAPAELCREVERLLRWYDAAFYSLDPVPDPEARGFVAEVSRLRAGLGGGAA